LAEALPSASHSALSSRGSLLAAVPAFAKLNLHVLGQLPRNQLCSLDDLGGSASFDVSGARTWAYRVVRTPTRLPKIHVPHTWCTAGIYPQMVTAGPASLGLRGT
jgi:hypothetical protein